MNHVIDVCTPASFYVYVGIFIAIVHSLDICKHTLIKYMLYIYNIQCIY